MAIFSRYIFRQALSALVLILVSLTAVIWIAVALKQLKLVTTSGQDATTFLLITTLAVPKLLALIAPIALLIATIFILNRLSGDSELIIVTASGGSLWRFAAPLLLLAAIVSGGAMLVNHLIMPASMKEVRSLITKVRTDLITQVLQPGKFAEADGGVTVHVRERALNGDLLGVLFHDARKPKEITTLSAERGRIVKTDTGTFLRLQNGAIIRQADVIAPSEIIRFQSYAIDLSSLQKAAPKHSWRANERYTSELIFLDADDPYVKRARGKLVAELHERFAGPLYPFVFVLIALAFMGQAQSTRTSRTKAMVASFVVAATVRVLGLAANNMIARDDSAIPLLYAVPILGMLLALFIIRVTGRPTATGRALTALQFRIEEAVLGLIRSLTPRGRRAPDPQPARP
ncbi:MAG: LPS export ABC transporter permease LptF [Pseudomonadota bacterium]